MSDDADDEFLKWVKEQRLKREEERKIHREKNGQFKKGFSANRAGRPPHRERAFLPRQKTRDILEVTEEILEIKTATGIKKLSAFQIILLKMRNKALEGHGPSMNRMLRIHGEALQSHYDAHKGAAKLLDQMEAGIVESGEPVSNYWQKHMNEGRKLSRKT